MNSIEQQRIISIFRDAMKWISERGYDIVHTPDSNLTYDNSEDWKVPCWLFTAPVFCFDVDPFMALCLQQKLIPTIDSLSEDKKIQYIYAVCEYLKKDIDWGIGFLQGFDTLTDYEKDLLEGKYKRYKNIYPDAFELGKRLREEIS